MSNSFGYPSGSDASSMKRARAGSISGRLRAASDLEEIGLIDRAQKGVLKDLIITGDSDLQNALDKYSRGDTSELEAIIKSGTLSRKQSLDLLDGLDLDFLNVYRKDTASNLDDFNIDQTFDDDAFRFRGLSDMNPDMFRGSFDFGAPPALPAQAPSSSKRSLSTTSQPSTAPPTNQYISPMNPYSSMSMPYDPYMNPSSESGGLTSDLFATSGEVDMFAYERMAQSLQQQQAPHMLPRYGQQQPFQSGVDNNRPFSSRPVPTPMMQQAAARGASTANNTLVPSSTGGYSSTSASNPITLPKRPQDASEKGYIGAYSPESRKERIERFIEKRKRRVWTKKVKYDVRKNFADSRLRVKGRFVKKEDEELLRELMSI